MCKIRLLVAVILLFSCNEQLIKEPKNLISKDKMAAIYYDLAVITSAKNTNSQILMKQGIETMNYIYTKHGIDSLQFVESDLFYAANPIIYKEIYEKAESRLKAEVQKIEEARKAQQKIDSIARIEEIVKPLDSLIVN